MAEKVQGCVTRRDKFARGARGKYTVGDPFSAVPKYAKWRGSGSNKARSCSSASVQLCRVLISD